MTNFALFIALVAILLAIFFWFLNRDKNIGKKTGNKHKFKNLEEKNAFISDINKLWDLVRKEFSEMHVLNRQDKVLICEIAKLRGEPRERVIIRIDKSNEKKLVMRDEYMVASYPYVPSKQEMRKDFAPVLNIKRP